VLRQRCSQRDIYMVRGAKALDVSGLGSHVTDIEGNPEDGRHITPLQARSKARSFVEAENARKVKKLPEFDEKLRLLY